MLVQTSKYVLKTLLKSVFYQEYGLERSWIENSMKLQLRLDLGPF